jgi:TPP-dependent pyruvate/acetoin dehydrogenase alpha subunit
MMCACRRTKELEVNMAAKSDVTLATNAQESSVDMEEWLHMYRQMFRIRAFEEQVNELYTKAIMPGLAHLYIGEEAVAVGVARH